MTTPMIATEGYLYLIREREFASQNRPIYKLGKTRQQDGKRFNCYPKGSVVEIMLRVANSDTAEVEAKRVFGTKFTTHPEIGSEYYEGDRIAMLGELVKFIGQIESKESVVTPSIDYKPVIDALKSVFYPIFHGMHCNLTFTFMKHSMRSLHATHNINRVYESGGQPEIKPDEAGVIINVAGFMKDMKKSYGKPTATVHVSAEQYHHYCGAHNAICRLEHLIVSYEQSRAKLSASVGSRYFAFKVEHMVGIDMIAYNIGRLKCHDFKQHGKTYETYPE